MKQAGLVQYKRRGVYMATEDGLTVLAQNPERINIKFLRRYDAFVDFLNRKKKKADTDRNIAEITNDTDSTPEELLVAAHQEIHDALASDLLDRIRAASPKFFESLIIKLLLKMGYGGAFEDATRALGQSGDNGVDGVVDQDLLGVDQIYIQAKRFSQDNTVGPGSIRDFCGALDLRKAKKGLFFTTSTFSDSARESAEKFSVRIVLIDGQQLTELMIRHNVGCRDDQALYLKKVDEDFFEQ